ncbi:MAG TPA: hypothetical protein VEX68_14115 [Bryobacteraceae bacterium]|nr:hypothetical protein [Bryobacteraceae bacterium]
MNTNSTTALLPGISMGTTPNVKYPPARVREANFTVEQRFQDGSVFRASYVHTHAWNLDQNLQYNNALSTYVWQTTTGTALPTGTYASTATRPYKPDSLGRQRSLHQIWAVEQQRFAVELSAAFPQRSELPAFYVLSRVWKYLP